MSFFDLKIKRLAILLLPSFLRRPLMAALVQSAVQGCNVLYGQFMRWRQDKSYRLTHNGQVCYLRAVLNDQFDPVERRIAISDNTGYTDLLTLYQRDEDRSTHLPLREADKADVTFYRRGSDANGYDFWINIPIALIDTVDTARLNAIVALYKLASKRFSINYF